MTPSPWFVFFLLPKAGVVAVVACGLGGGKGRGGSYSAWWWGAKRVVGV
jgi:hypothetical protein